MLSPLVFPSFLLAPKVLMVIWSGCFLLSGAQDGDLVAVNLEEVP
jgi:hypothetical protein